MKPRPSAPRLSARKTKQTNEAPNQTSIDIPGRFIAAGNGGRAGSTRIDEVVMAEHSWINGTETQATEWSLRSPKASTQDEPVFHVLPSSWADPSYLVSG